MSEKVVTVYRCPITGKIIYWYGDRAREAALKIAESTGEENWRAYKCPGGLHWHVGHKRPRGSGITKRRKLLAQNTLGLLALRRVAIVCDLERWLKPQKIVHMGD